MITRTRFSNFKLLRDVEIELDQLNVIVGANGVGKSSVLEGLGSILGVAGRARAPRIPSALALLHFTGDRAPEALTSTGASQGFGIEVETDATVRYRIQHRRGAESPQYPFDHELKFDAKREPIRFPGRPDDSIGLTTSTEEDFFDRLANCGFNSFANLRLDAHAIQRPHHSNNAELRLTDGGGGLPWVLQRILTSRDGTFERLEAAIAEVLPEFKRMRTRQQTIQIEDSLPIRIGETEHLVPQSREVIGARLEVEWGKVGWIRAEQLSEGTLLVISLLTALHDSPPKIILIDDLDRGLHPSAQVALVTALKKVLAAQPTLQVLATTHSPYVVDAIDAERVLVASCPDGNAARIRGLSDNPDWVSRKAYFSPGEFWSAVGEGWVGERTT